LARTTETILEERWKQNESEEENVVENSTIWKKDYAKKMAREEKRESGAERFHSLQQAFSNEALKLCAQYEI